MDSFSDPYTRQGDDISIEQVRENIASLEEQHRKIGIPLSGRIIHVCHYLPITATLLANQTTNVMGVLSPPATPPSRPTDVPGSGPFSSSENDLSTTEQVNGETPSSVWSFAPRHGHAAMISGIRSLSHSHEQLIVGWTGDILSSPTETIPSDGVSQKEREEFETALKNCHPKESDPDDERDRKTKYVPVWLDDKVAHGHYDGYCKQSTCSDFLSLSLLTSWCCSSLAPVPLSFVAGRRH